ncbi:hypothetical protein EGW08_015033, partial [Elysia chlorotica]
MTQGEALQKADSLTRNGFHKQDNQDISSPGRFLLPHADTDRIDGLKPPQKPPDLQSGELQLDHPPGLNGAAVKSRPVTELSKLVDPENGQDGQEDSHKGEVKTPKLDTRMKIYLVLYIFVVLVCSCKMALPAPFFPREAENKGASSTFIGLIFSVFELVVTTASPLFGRYMTHFGTNWLFISGLFLSGSATVSFGFLHMCPAGAWFMTLAIVARGLEALGFAATSTSFMTTMCYFFPNNYASVYALGCSLASVGFMLGPPIGAGFYEIGGFGLPFYVMGGITLVINPFLIPL